MHCSLQIPEVVALICTQISPTETPETLAALARTCKAFSDPALDILWRNASLANVLNCLPHLETGTFTDGSDFSIPLLPSDWERVLVYSKRVRQLTMEGDDYTAPYLETLRLCFPGQHLFPNIEDLDWGVLEKPIFPHIAFFLGPRLTTLSVGYFSTAAHLSFLGIVAIRCPLLAVVEIVFSDDLQLELDQMDGMKLVNHLRSLSYFVRALRHLKTLTVPSLDCAAFDHIARLPTFASLTLTNQFPIITVAASTNPPDGRLFGSLQSLSLTGTTIDVLSAIIAQVTQASIRNVWVSFPELTTSHVLVQLYAAIAASCSHGSLTNLSLHYPSSFNPQTASAFSMSGSHLRPLFAYTNITEVSLWAPAGFELDDAIVADMARAWPHIRRLKLSASDTHIQPTVTLGSLLYFARHCPTLAFLHLALNATTIPKLQSGTGAERVQQLCLQILYLPSSPITSSTLVAVFLSNVFPNLDQVGGVPNNWRAVGEALPGLRLARAEERSWAAQALAE
ncbi:hypothetical protein K438DRAFT_25811 [Mycena galopus ATCC 62051]|nr:hypothetical protein K438DRAFT_25811 [Mycena galopus ATCC 62051]